MILASVVLSQCTRVTDNIHTNRQTDDRQTDNITTIAEFCNAIAIWLKLVHDLRERITCLRVTRNKIIQIYTVVQKTGPVIFSNNFNKY